MSSSSNGTTNLTYLNALTDSLPPSLSSRIKEELSLGDLSESSSTGVTRHFLVDLIVRFAAGAPPPNQAPPSSPPLYYNEWNQGQRDFTRLVNSLMSFEPDSNDAVPPTGNNNNNNAKRPFRDLESESTVPSSTGNSTTLANSNSKRQKTEQPANTGSSSSSSTSIQSPPLFTLNSISVTCPIRKKVNVNVTSLSITLSSPTATATRSGSNATSTITGTAAEEQEESNILTTIPLSSLKRAFIVPTRGKSKPHWTVIFISSDVASESSSPQQIIFGVDALAPPNFSFIKKDTSTTSPPTKVTLRKGQDPTKPVLLDFIACTGIPLFEPSAQVFKSACVGIGVSATTLPDGGNGGSGGGSGGIPGVEGYRAAKPGTLWFFDHGLLWGESKPCEFWAVEDLVPRSDAVRTISATGRTCSIYLTKKKMGRGQGEEDVEEEDEEEESELSMVDGKEQERIAEWVRAHCHLFGKKKNEIDGKTGSTSSEKPKNLPPLPPSGPLTIQSMIAHDEDDDDEDFSLSDSELDSENESDSSSSPGDGSQKEEPEAEDSDDSQDLDPRRHPLLRPGAMPKNVSKAAIDMVVGMVEQDVVMGGPEDSGEDDGVDELDE